MVLQPPFVVCILGCRTRDFLRSSQIFFLPRCAGFTHTFAIAGRAERGSRERARVDALRGTNIHLPRDAPHDGVVLVGGRAFSARST
jgi:hypothetical protein